MNMIGKDPVYPVNPVKRLDSRRNKLRGLFCPQITQIAQILY